MVHYKRCEHLEKLNIDVVVRKPRPLQGHTILELVIITATYHESEIFRLQIHFDSDRNGLLIEL